MASGSSENQEYQKRNNNREGFTLIELLVVIAIIAVLAVVLILTLNPAELLRQSRDARRISDISTITNALNLYNVDQAGGAGYSLGVPLDTYPSIADPSATSTAGDQCQALGMPAFLASTGESWQCAASSSYRNVNATGWIPVNLSKLSSGAPIGSLPIDPINQTSSGLFYSYNMSGTQFEVVADLESQKYKTQFGGLTQTIDFPEVISGGVPTISALYSPSALVGYWPLTEGAGSTAVDQSGNGNSGTWNGTPIGNNATYYNTAKVGAYAGYFDGSTDYINVANQANFNFANTTFTVAGWFKTGSTADGWIIGKGGNGSGWGVIINGYCNYYGNLIVVIKDSSNNEYYECSSDGTLNDNTWHYFVAVITTNTTNPSLETSSIYIDGALNNGTSVADALPYNLSTSTLEIGARVTGTNYSGSLNDLRVYNRALSPAEVAALYDAER